MTEPDYITVNVAVDPHKFNTVLMVWDDRQQEYSVGRCSQALPKTAALALALSWAAVKKLEIR